MLKLLLVFVLISPIACGSGLKFDTMFFNPTPSNGIYDFGDAITEEVWLDTSDGHQIQAFFVEPSTRAIDHVTVLYSHGNAHNIGFSIDRILLFVNDFGWSVLIYDYRGYGASEGEPTPEGVREDGLTAYNHLLQRDDVDPDRIVGYGYSLGTHVTLSYANTTTGQKPIMVVLEAPLASIESLVEDGSRLAIPGNWLFDDPLDNVALAQTLDVPCLILHGDEDDQEHFSNGTEVYENLMVEPRELVRVRGAGHRDIPTDTLPSYAAAIKGFLAEVERE